MKMTYCLLKLLIMLRLFDGTVSVKQLSNNTHDNVPFHVFWFLPCFYNLHSYRLNSIGIRGTSQRIIIKDTSTLFPWSLYLNIMRFLNVFSICWISSTGSCPSMSIHNYISFTSKTISYDMFILRGGGDIFCRCVWSHLSCNMEFRCIGISNLPWQMIVSP